MGADTSKLNAPAVDASLLSAKKKTAAQVAEEPFKDLERAPAAPFENLVAGSLPRRQGMQNPPGGENSADMVPALARPSWWLASRPRTVGFVARSEPRCRQRAHGVGQGTIGRRN